MDRATRSYPKTASLSSARNAENLLLFIDDDMRETALALSRIENYLVETLKMLEADRLDRADVQAMASDKRVLDHVDQLNETLESLRRRMAKLAANLR